MNSAASRGDNRPERKFEVKEMTCKGKLELWAGESGGQSRTTLTDANTSSRPAASANARKSRSRVSRGTP